MKDKLIRWMNSTKYTAHFLRLIVGGYVVYLGGQVVYNFFVDDEVSVPLLLCAFLIALCGLAIMAICAWAILRGYSIEYQGRAPWLPAEESAETEESESVEALEAPLEEEKKE